MDQTTPSPHFPISILLGHILSRQPGYTVPLPPFHYINNPTFPTMKEQPSPHAKIFRKFVTHRSDSETEETAFLNHYVWEENGNYEGNLRGYCIEQFIREYAEDSMECFVKSRNQFRLKDGRRIPIIQEGMIFFTIDGRLCLLEVADCVEEIKHTLRTKEAVGPLAEAINTYIREKNPVRGNFLQILPEDGNHLSALFRENPDISKDDLILDPVMMEDIFDNTVVTLRDLQESNGIIIHGPPGVGKSLCCNLASKWMLEAGYTVLYLDTRVPFSALDSFLQQFCAPCLLILEDIDTFAEDRVQGRMQQSLADFLQFMNGLTRRNSPVVVIATTNHLDFLDEAIRNRPVRFNRTYYFGEPDNHQIDLLLQRRFGSDTLQEEQRILCHNRNLRGAHVEEIHRTARMLSFKRNCRLCDVFDEAVRVVLGENFQAETPVGFTP